MDSINNACKLGGDAWLELQAFKTRQLNRREKLNRHKNLHKNLINGIPSNPEPIAGLAKSQAIRNPAPAQSSYGSETIGVAGDNKLSSSSASNSSSPSLSSSSTNHTSTLTTSQSSTSQQNTTQDAVLNLFNPAACSSLAGTSAARSDNQDTNLAHSQSRDLFNLATDQIALRNGRPVSNSNGLDISDVDQLLHSREGVVDESQQDSSINLELVECLLLLKLCDVALKLPIDSNSLLRSICRVRSLESTSKSLIENFLQKFAHQELITLDDPSGAARSHLPGQRSESMAMTGERLSSGPSGSKLAIQADKNDLVSVDESCIYVTSADHTKLVEFDKSFGSMANIRSLLNESKLTNDDQNLSTEENESSVAITLVPNHGVKPGSKLENLSSSKSSLSDLDIKLQSDRDINTSNNNLLPIVKPKSLPPRNQLSVGLKYTESADDDLESLLSLSSTKERESKKLGEELLELLSKPTAKERNLMERFRSTDGYQVQEFCPKGTKGECRRNNDGQKVCDKLHFKKIIAKHTEESLGDCSFLNTCFHMDSCKYVHYKVDYDEKSPQFKRPHPTELFGSDMNSNVYPHSLNQNVMPNSSFDCYPTHSSNKQDVTANNSMSTCTSATSATASTCLAEGSQALIPSATSTRNCNMKTGKLDLSEFALSPEEQAKVDAKNRKRFKTVLYPPQWIQCDLRFFDMSLLGKFSVVMADPPWDIHMELPYGTMSDDEMRKLNVPALQDEGVIFLWVTGRAMELGRECLALWGYERCDEIIWVKTNQLQRIIRTGRTGHWLNHGKEHCLVGVKGNPKDINRGLDCDVIVAEVRATSHKPDEIYGIIERLSPGTRKIELFGRAHNVQPNWITLGNQLNGVRLIEPNLINAFKKLNLPFQTSG